MEGTNGRTNSASLERILDSDGGDLIRLPAVLVSSLVDDSGGVGRLSSAMFSRVIGLMVSGWLFCSSGYHVAPPKVATGLRKV